jgi:hypothetical protein
VTIPGAAASAVFQSPAQKFSEFPSSGGSTGLTAFSSNWRLGNSQHGDLALSSQIRPGLTLDAAYIWVKGTHLARSRDYNPTDSLRAAAFLAAGNSSAALLGQNYFRSDTAVSDTMTMEGSASSIYNGLRLGVRGQINPALTVNASYTFAKSDR